MMGTQTINHYNYNTGNKEVLTLRDSRTLSLDHISMRCLVEEAKKPKGLQFSSTITFKINDWDISNHPEENLYQNYMATFYYKGNPFLITLGCYWDYNRKVWFRVMNLGDSYKLTTPLLSRIARSFVVDMIIPPVSMDVLAFLYNNDCHKFTRNLGWAMLSPKSYLF